MDIEFRYKGHCNECRRLVGAGFEGLRRKESRSGRGFWEDFTEMGVPPQKW